MPEGKPAYVKAQCPYCQTEQGVEVIVKDGRLDSAHKKMRCRVCGKIVWTGHDGSLWKPWNRILFVMVAYGLVLPSIALDAIIWKKTNKLSIWIQKTFNISKYHLTLAAYFLSMSFFLWQLPFSGISILIWTFLGWDVISYCIHQIRSGGSEEEETEQVSLAEAHLLVKYRVGRVTCLVIGGILSLTFAKVSFDPASAGVMVYSLIGYFIDSKYIPPSRRKVLDFGLKWARAGSS
jgi:hypothetical protein